jgi:hypothetical protein
MLNKNSLSSKDGVNILLVYIDISVQANYNLESILNILIF